jgi:uncharacterized linocin/CFP29 family protein
MKIKDYILNGVAHGSVGGMLMRTGFNPGVLRPFIADPSGRGPTFISMQDGWRTVKDKKGNKHKKPNYRTSMLNSATGVLTYDEWKQIDQTVVRAAMPELTFFNQLRAANQVTIPNGLGTTVLESMMIGDITPAEINMDGLARADQDRPLTDMTGVPLPIIHKDFTLPLRDVMVSRKSGYPLDTALPVDAAVKVGEEVEKMAVGVGLNYQFAGRHIWGMTNFPGRLTVELSDPEAPGWEGADLIDDIVEMKAASKAVGFRGPWRVYHGSGWDGYLEKDYSGTKGTNTLADRVQAIRGIRSIESLDFMPEFDIVLIQMDARVARAIVALPLTTLQWEQQGGMEINLKVMTIMVPEFRADFYGGTGLVHGAVGGFDES